MRITTFFTYFFLFITVFSFIGFYLAIRPTKINSTLTPEKLGLSYENVSFVTQDNVRLRGWFIPSNMKDAKTIILLHGYPADKGNILPAMAFLQKKYNLLLFDFRYFGESEGSYSTVGKNEVLDLLAAINYLKSTRNIKHVGVWGFSMGAAVAIMTAPRAPEIKAIVAESSYANLELMSEEYYRIPVIKKILAKLSSWWAYLFIGIDIKLVSPTKAISNINIPILIIHSKQDDVIPYKHAEILTKSLTKNSAANLITLEQSVHGQLMDNHEEVIMNFFDKYLNSVN